MSSIYEYQSRFQKQFGSDAAEFDTCSPLLRSEIIRLLQAKNLMFWHGLERLHEWLKPELKKYDSDYGINGISAMLYETDELFEQSYLFFIKKLKEHFDFPFYFQKTPTIRIQTPGSEGSNFYPWYHNDMMFGHPPEEINLWVPLTALTEPQGHGFRRMSVADTGEEMERFKYNTEHLRLHYGYPRVIIDSFKPTPAVTTPYGKLLAFDSRCLHSAEPMEAHTRVSMDIRIIPVEDYDALYTHQPLKGTGRKGVLYAPGHAYHEKNSHELG